MEQELKQHIAQALTALYSIENAPVVIEPTKADFEGDYTFVVFPYVKQSKKSPEQTATEIGEYLVSTVPLVSAFNVIKGFLNLSIQTSYWINFVKQNYTNSTYGWSAPNTKQKVLVEYSSPNTNKPLHLGHVRNNLLGFSVAQILKANGYNVTMCNLVNDRGIHICKSMYAWMKFGNGETPQSAGMKGDHLVGKYYVAFDKQYKAEQKDLVEKGISEADAEKQAPSILAAQDLLRKWEANDEETVNVWKMMNGWVYEGFDITYKKMGVSFDKYYYESNTYLLGKEIVQEGLAKNVFYKKDDGSVWVDLTGDGLDQKLLLRGDGTSVYMTQDIGTAELKYADFGSERSIYVSSSAAPTSFDAIRALVLAGYNGGGWDGTTGITSTFAQSNPQRFGIAIERAGEFGSPDLVIRYDALADNTGVNLDPGAVLVKFTLNGDTDLSSGVDFIDLANFVNGFEGMSSGWAAGDFNYDGMTDITDWKMFVQGFVQTSFNRHGESEILAGQDLANLVQNENNLTAAQKQELIAAIPEPGSLGIVGCSVVAGIWRRRRR